MLYKYKCKSYKKTIYINQCMIYSIMYNSFEDNAEICQLT